jgi:histone deacetylase HOS3
VNNVAIGAAHGKFHCSPFVALRVKTTAYSSAYLRHGISRAIILDIDLHHGKFSLLTADFINFIIICTDQLVFITAYLPTFPGNGTQAIVWAINAETERRRLDLEAQAAVGALGSYQASSYPPDPYPPVNETASLSTSGTPVWKPTPISAKPGLRIFYGSAHDILSYPCEDGNPELVRDASISLPHGAHGQWIENVHLETYESEQEFWIGHEDEGAYERTFGKLLRSAEQFVRRTRSRESPTSQQAQRGEAEDDVIIFISCGFDASEHEYPSMSRHGRHVPASFYYRFARDVRALADKHARGRVVSVLEGGYSDRALIAGGMAWLTGLVGHEPPTSDDDKLATRNKNEEAVDQYTGKTDNAIPSEAWVHRAGPRDWWALGNLEKVSVLKRRRTCERDGVDSFGNNPTLRGSLWGLHSSKHAKGMLPMKL